MLRPFGALLAFSLLAGVSAFAQSPTAVSSASQLPLHGFIPPFEILRTVRAAGFDPLAPPLRQGTIYVVRAIDFRGVAMRVVVDARSGVIRDANRIIPSPGLYGPYALGRYAPGPYALPPYAPPPPYTAAIPSDDPDELHGPPLYAPGSAANALVPALVPLPRPRPGGVAARGAIEPKVTSKPDAAGSPPPPQSEPSSKAAQGVALPLIND